jgi:DHA3 family macrolide efflux protein-like MFS transporter
MLAAGVMLPLFNTPSMVLLQEKVEGDYLGRIFGVMSMLTTSMMPIGMLVFGPIADYIAIELLLIGTGICIVLIGMLIYRNKTLIAAGQSSPAEEA